jgi:putative ATP-binding cassette transporter
MEVPHGKRLLIMGPGGSGKTSLLRAAAGLWPAGQGRIIRPPLGEVLFLPQQPYLALGSLRDQLLYGVPEGSVSVTEIFRVLREVHFGPVLERVGGLDVERDWQSTLSRGEQQVLAFARLLLANPRFAFLDEATSALEGEETLRLYETLSRTPISYVSVAKDARLLAYHDLFLELEGDGAWKIAPADGSGSITLLLDGDRPGRQEAIMSPSCSLAIAAESVIQPEGL